QDSQTCRIPRRPAAHQRRQDPASRTERGGVMPIPASLNKNLTLPVICAPMFIVSNPDLVIAQCKSGVIGSFPALNARPKEELNVWLQKIKAALANDPNAAPFAVNQIIFQSNERLEHDMALCVEHRVPLIITSLAAPKAIVPQVHAY